jgi:hypothetical protein
MAVRIFNIYLFFLRYRNFFCRASHLLDRHSTTAATLPAPENTIFKKSFRNRNRKLKLHTHDLDDVVNLFESSITFVGDPKQGL